MGLSWYVKCHLGYVTEPKQGMLILVIVSLIALGFWTNPWLGLLTTTLTALYCIKKIFHILNPQNRLLIWLKNHPYLYKLLK